MENKKERNEEIQSRREFFKKAAKGALPILGMLVLNTTLLTSCNEDDSYFSTGCTGSSCVGSCDNSCSGDCDSSCTDNCALGCSYGCSGSCRGTSVGLS